MFDLSVFDDYLHELSFFDKSFIEQRVSKYGVNGVLEVQFNCLDCSKRTSTGDTVQQTNGFSYRSELSKTIYIIQNNIKSESIKDELYNKILELHNKNLQWEIEHPPVPVNAKRIKGERKQKEKKETAAERKLKERAAKIGKLSINIKMK